MRYKDKINAGYYEKNLISIIGLGYIGLPTAALIASKGYKVIGVDINTKIVNSVNQGHTHIIESGLEKLVCNVVAAGNLRATETPQAAHVFIIAVSTPLTKDNKPDLSFVEAAIESIIPLLNKGNLVIIESTLPVGTTEKIAQKIAQARPDLKIPSTTNQESGDIYIAHCPERVLPGRIIEELISNARIVGGITPICTEKAISFYSNFVEGKCSPTNSRTAEITKLAENAFRDVNIAFANELSMICDELDVSIWELIDLANRHPRVNILNPGAGVGGHCLAIDPWFIIDASPKTATLIKAAREVNKYKTEHVLKKILQAMRPFENPIIACLGLTYKENIDDLRESPALEIVEKLAQTTECHVIVVEPHIEELPVTLKNHSAKIILSHSLDVLMNADILVCLVPHKKFKSLPDFCRNKMIIDFCKLYYDHLSPNLLEEQWVI